MFLKFLPLVALVVGTLTEIESSMLQDLEHWENFKVQYRRRYQSKLEEERRKHIFMDNLKFVRAHNARFDRGEESYYVAINKFSDMTSEELTRTLTGFKEPPGLSRTGRMFDDSMIKSNELPKEVNWTEKGAVTPVKNQGRCGSCYAFSAVAAMEAMYFLKTNRSVSLSEQELVDCSGVCGNGGCNGGFMELAFLYAIVYGLAAEKTYPYTGKEGKCRANATERVANVTSFVRIQPGNETAMQAAVAQNGPVSVAMCADRVFMMYKGGVFNNTECSYGRLNHGMAAVGFSHKCGVNNNTKCWMMKNSWGKDWGEGGYVYMLLGVNLRGIANMTSFPQN